MPAKWTGAWKGGRIAKTKHGDSYTIEKMIDGARYQHRLGVVSETKALAELGTFLENPKGYRPPVIRAAEAEAEDEAERQRQEASAVILTEGLIKTFTESMAEGAKPASTHHIFVTHSYLSKWAVSDVLHGRDLRSVSTKELNAHIDALKASKKHWIVSLKSLTAWLRSRGDLKASEDPTMPLSVPQAKKLGPDEKAEKVYAIEQLEETYSEIPNQDVRDVFRIRCATGLHVSEIKRIAKGKCVIKAVAGSKIAATIDVGHKAGQTHRQSVDAETLAAIERLRAGKTFPTEKTFTRNRKTAAEKSGQPEVYIANLRHTFATLSTEHGTVVMPPQAKAGVPLQLVSQIIGHHDMGTTDKFYLGQKIPPMVALPINLSHPSDPKLAKKPSKQAAGRVEHPKRARG